MKSKYIITFALLLYLSVNSFAGTGGKICGTVNDPVRQNQIAKKLQSRNSSSVSFSSTQSWVDTIHVVFHVLWSTTSMNIADSLIEQQIETLNQDYSRTNPDTVNTPAPFKPLAGALPVYFKLAQTDSTGAPTTGILRYQTSHAPFTYADHADLISTANGGADPWNSKYMNIYSAPMPANYTGVGFPGENVLLINYLEVGQKRTCTHEMGHNLGLSHIWGPEGGGGPFVCSSDDNIADTPPQEAPSFLYCGPFPHLDNCTPGGNGVMYMNYMDYNDDDCVNMFTIGQVNVMAATLNGILNDLIGGASVGITEQDAENNFSAFPNPNNGNFTLSNRSNQKFDVSIFNASGQLVFEKNNITDSNLPVSIDKGKGVYTIVFTMENKKREMKIIVK